MSLRGVICSLRSRLDEHLDCGHTISLLVLVARVRKLGGFENGIKELEVK